MPKTWFLSRSTSPQWDRRDTHHGWQALGLIIYRALLRTGEKREARHNLCPQGAHTDQRHEETGAVKGT